MRSEIVEGLKAYAEENYSNGFSFFVECYGKEEWTDFVDGVESLEDGLEKMKALAEAKAIQATEVGGEW